MTTNFKMHEASSRAMAIDKDGAKPQIGAEKYPWRALEVGKCFIVDTKTSPVKLQTLQSAASRWSKKLGKRFRVVDWPESNVIEVARLPDDIKSEAIMETELTKPDEVVSVDADTSKKFW